ncbi:hypothetical protein DH2020_035794 [Rehmannia glutinosa]|uniref:Uncharacterized protein n=1 Tax=Rehmannia glutinosa TaxID=99300 RepID=A0ABR0V802_REHGL
MGCGESKQAVATENTLTKTKSSTKNSLQNNPPLEISTNDENLKENEIIDAIKEETTTLPEKKGKENENENSEEKKENMSKKTENEKEKEIEKVEAVVVVEENKGEAKNEEFNGENERLIVKDSAPDNLSSPKKETTESVISGKSDHDSPRAKDNVSDAEGKEKEIEANSNKEKEEDIKVDEGKELAPADETKSPAADETKSFGEEKTPAAKHSPSEEGDAQIVKTQAIKSIPVP